MEKYIEQLNEAQKAPVFQKNGAMMVIAGAGSGKTRVLTCRIAYLMRQGIDAFNILALTFTNKAAREMKARVANMVGSSEAKNLWMGTFHSIFAKILRIEADKLGYPSNFVIYDSQDSQRLLASIIKEQGLDKELYKYKQVQNRISSFKNNLITVNAYSNYPELIEADTMARRPKMGAIYKEYVERCFKSGAMDFDDLLLKTNELLNVYPEVLMKYQERFKYIMVDEYQDTNHSQYLIVKALSDRYQNICVVGDDAQSIYAFRGANIQNILNFQKDYEKVTTYRLEQNYRSTGNIVKAANSIIEKNKTRLEKVVWTANEDGNKILINRCITDAEEGRYVANTIEELKRKLTLPYGDFAVLYRTNSQSRSIEDALRKKDIPYRIYGGVSFYQRKEIKDVLAYLKLVLNPKDEEGLKRIINFPARGIGKTTLDKLLVTANHYKRSIFEIMEHLEDIDLKINAGTQKKLEDFVTMIKSFQVVNQTADAFQISEYVIKKTGIMLEFKKDATPEGLTRMENIEELLNGIQDFVDGQKELADAQGSLQEFLEDIALVTDMDKNSDTGEDRTALMTIHLAKGLEFPRVFIVGMEENLFPSAMSMNTRTELEEERRLFYVALTRAEKQAYLTYTQNRYRWGKLIDAEPSRFIEEINPQLVEHLSPDAAEEYRYEPTLDINIFKKTNSSNLDSQKTPYQKPSNRFKLEEKLSHKLKKTHPNTHSTLESKIKEGNIISHTRFGKGKVIKIQGIGNDKKAEVLFENGQVKNLLLRFAKLKIIN